MFSCGTSGITLLVEESTKPRPFPARMKERPTASLTSRFVPWGSLLVTDTQPHTPMGRPAESFEQVDVGVHVDVARQAAALQTRFRQGVKLLHPLAAVIARKASVTAYRTPRSARAPAGPRRRGPGG